MATKQEINAGFHTVKAVADAIRDLKEVPSGTLYANLMGKFSLAQYESVIRILKNAGLVVEKNFLLIWVEPKI